MAINQKWLPSTLRYKRDAEQEKKDYEKMLRSAKTAFTRLQEIIEQEVQELHAPKALDDYSSGWDYKQADRLGQLRAYRNILTLLEFINDQRKHP